MKLKHWLHEYKNLTYSQYKELSDLDKIIIGSEHREFCYKENIKKEHAKQGWRQMTPEESKWVAEITEKEHKRYIESKMIGGIDERGNYTALHHRWEK